MVRIISIILIVFFILVSAFLVYLNKVIIPEKVYPQIIKELENATGKKVTLEGLSLSIWRGVVLKGLSIYDDKSYIIEVREISARPLFVPFFRKEFLIPSIMVRDPKILLERREDGSINLSELISKKFKTEGNYKFIVHKVILNNASIHFVDRTLKTPFEKDIEKFDAHIYLSLPANIQFDLAFQIPSEEPATVDISGEYYISEGSVKAKAIVGKFNLREFAPYYEDAAIEFPEGTADISAQLSYRDGSLEADIEGMTKELTLKKGSMTARIESEIEAKVLYNIFDKNIKYSGTLNVTRLDINGIEFADRVEELKGIITFTDDSFAAENLSGKVFDIPSRISARFVNLPARLFDVYVNSDVELQVMQKILRQKCNIKIPAALEGKGKVRLSLQYELPSENPPKVSGAVDMLSATIRPEGKMPLIENVTGEIRYTSNQLMWTDLEFTCKDQEYTTSGVLTDFTNPGIHLSLVSEKLQLAAIMAFNKDTLILSKLDGKYLNSDFSITGSANMPPDSQPALDIAGTLVTNISDVKEVSKELKPNLDKMKLAGNFRSEFRLKGRLGDIKRCDIDAKVFSDSFTLLDYKPTNLIMDYRQRDGNADITRFHSFLYGGTLDATGTFDLVSEGMPYSFNADIKDVKLEKFKADTAFKDKDISGLIKARCNIKGYVGDASRINGSGGVAISNGNLWQLNLFQGLGMLLFTSDFSEITFNEGHCAFQIKDKAISVSDLELKSDLVMLRGSMAISFDNSIKANLKAEVNEEALEGTRQNIASAIGKYSYVEIGGTLKEPKYNIRPDMENIVEGVASALFGQ